MQKFVNAWKLYRNVFLMMPVNLNSSTVLYRWTPLNFVYFCCFYHNLPFKCNYMTIDLFVWIFIHSEILNIKIVHPKQSSQKSMYLLIKLDATLFQAKSASSGRFSIGLAKINSCKTKTKNRKLENQIPFSDDRKLCRTK